VHQVDDPAAFARTDFIEALQRAGVAVTAPPTGSNPAALLPPKRSYQPGDMLGEHVSLPLSQYISLVMKVSLLWEVPLRFPAGPRSERNSGRRLAEVPGRRPCSAQDR
jgi:hypothetical protein